MAKNPYQTLAKNPSQQQSSSMSGLQKGMIVDVRDSHLQGKARVWVYALHGDLVNVNVETLPWCEFAQSQRGSFSPAEIGDRALISFEASDKYAPVILAYWRGTPMARDNTLWSGPTGSEIRPEGWHHHNLYPESNILAMSGAGNGVWMEDKLVGKNLASVIHIETTGGDVMKASSFHLDCEGFAAFQKYEGGIGKVLDKSDLNKPVRDGVTKPDKAAGELELSNHNIKKLLITDKEFFSLDQTQQMNKDEEIGASQESLCGKVSRTRQGTASVSMVDEVVLLTGKAVAAMSFYTTPRIW